MESRRLFGLVSVLDRGEVVDVAAVGLDRREVKFNWKLSDHGRLQSVCSREWIRRQKAVVHRLKQAMTKITQLDAVKPLAISFITHV